ncbi:hypothetical protein HS088_TW20G00702 [Tripterygium wilfordii]|uniref:Ribosomal protein eL8/eL30/eS12/Gadd45 domain-containing protein n=1 Tax=Tripterygium wilfordii TaxID=458696 RepID=A0A7J7C868_TRIWF|nr:hypothetical protein HS088_TW20G00702 [Tripterygium wilfordii]
MSQEQEKSVLSSYSIVAKVIFRFGIDYLILYCSFYEGERLDSMLDSIKRGIESAKFLDGGSLPEKIWFKQQFSIGVNDVTRVLERMAPTSETGNSHEHHNVICGNRKVPLDKLQAVLLASDCNPRWLMKHLPSLASSRKVPIIYVKDSKRGSLRLGELVKLKTAIAIGVKARGNAINQNVDEILHGNKLNLEPAYLKVNEVPAVPSKDHPNGLGLLHMHSEKKQRQSE